MEIQYARTNADLQEVTETAPPHMMTRQRSITTYINEVFHKGPKGEFQVVDA